MRFSPNTLKKEQSEGKEEEGEGGRTCIHYHQAMSIYILLKFIAFSNGFIQ